MFDPHGDIVREGMDEEMAHALLHEAIHWHQLEGSVEWSATPHRYYLALRVPLERLSHFTKIVTTRDYTLPYQVVTSNDEWGLLVRDLLPPVMANRSRKTWSFENVL